MFPRRRSSGTRAVAAVLPESLWRGSRRSIDRESSPRDRSSLRAHDLVPITPVDLLVFGPHPDDIEIGMGGTVAKHAALGHRVGLCDLTTGEMGSNGTPSIRISEAEAARSVLGAAWRINLQLPD